MSKTFDFSNPEHVARYRQGPARFLPGYEAMQQLTAALLDRHIGEDADLLVLGAGGGLELAAFAKLRPGWRFTGLDPSEAMLEAAAVEMKAIGASDRVKLVRGYIPEVPPGPYDAATCLLTLHFVSDNGDKLEALRTIRAQLKPGAPFALLDLCIDLASPEADGQLADYAAFPTLLGVDPDDVKQAVLTIRTSLPVVGADREVQLLGQAGFSDVRLYWSAHAWRGWLAYA